MRHEGFDLNAGEFSLLLLHHLLLQLLDLLDALLKLQELAHEVEVGGDNGASTLDELVRVPGGHREVLDEVSDGDGGRP